MLDTYLVHNPARPTGQATRTRRHRSPKPIRPRTAISLRGRRAPLDERGPPLEADAVAANWWTTDSCGGAAPKFYPRPPVSKPTARWTSEGSRAVGRDSRSGYRTDPREHRGAKLRRAFTRCRLPASGRELPRRLPRPRRRRGVRPCRESRLHDLRPRPSASTSPRTAAPRPRRSDVGFVPVSVTHQVIGYLRRRLSARWSTSSELEMPEFTLETTAAMYHRTRSTGGQRNWPRPCRGSLHAAEHAAIGLPRSRAATVATSAGCPPPTASVDCPRCSSGRAPGGAGSPSADISNWATWLSATAAAIRACECDRGCPSCVQSRSAGAKRSPRQGGRTERARLRSGEAQRNPRPSTDPRTVDGRKAVLRTLRGAPKLPAEVSATQTEIPSGRRKKYCRDSTPTTFPVLRAGSSSA